MTYVTNQEEERQRVWSTMLPSTHSPRLLHSSSDIGSSFGMAGIAGSMLVFKGTFDPALGHATSEGRDTERYVGSGGPFLILGGGTEAFERQIG